MRSAGKTKRPNTAAGRPSGGVGSLSYRPLKSIAVAATPESFQRGGIVHGRTYGRTDGRTDAVSAMERVQAPRGRRCQIYSRTLKAGESGSRARSQGRRPIVFPSRVRPSITAADEIKYGRRLSVGPSGRANERQSRDGRQTIVDKAGRPGSGGRTVSRWPDTTNPRRTNLTQRRYQRQRGATLTSRGQTSERMIARRTASSPPRPTTTHDARRMHCVASR